MRRITWQHLAAMTVTGIVFTAAEFLAGSTTWAYVLLAIQVVVSAGLVASLLLQLRRAPR